MVFRFKNYTFPIFFSLVLITTNVSSQTNEQFSVWEYTCQTISDDAVHAFNIGIGLLKSPATMDKNDLLNFAGAGAITASLFLADKGVNKFSLKNHSKFNDKLFKIDDYLNGTTGLYASAGIYLTGFFFVEPNIRRMGLNIAETILISQSITSVLKYSFGRRRPYAGENNMDFKLFRGNKDKYRSFPSGHTTGAFAFASVMAMSVDNMYWKTLWYGSAGMVGMARVYHNKHWLSDTFMEIGRAHV